MNHDNEIVAKQSLIYQTTIWLNEISNIKWLQMLKAETLKIGHISFSIKWSILKTFLLKIDKKLYKRIVISYIEYIAIKKLMKMEMFTV